MLLKSGDFLGGIFGNELGISNTYLHILLILILILSVVNYVSDNSSLVILTSYIVSTLYVAALSELKIIFVELPIIIILTLLFKRLGIKILLKIISITCIVVVALAISIPILYELFPIFDNFLN
ncbi:putative membrane protein [Streptococcus pneumoniae GA47283]|nr:putative membrane protein [Streptococcus pneumoniae GA47283]